MSYIVLHSVLICMLCKACLGSGRCYGNYLYYCFCCSCCHHHHCYMNITVGIWVLGLLFFFFTLTGKFSVCPNVRYPSFWNTRTNPQMGVLGKNWTATRVSAAVWIGCGSDLFISCAVVLLFLACWSLLLLFPALRGETGVVVVCWLPNVPATC